MRLPPGAGVWQLFQARSRLISLLWFVDFSIGKPDHEPFRKELENTLGRAQTLSESLAATR